MSPRAVVEAAHGLGLHMMAISDHNSVENAEAAMRLGKRLGMVVLPGMEVCSREEVHLLTIFDTIDRALAMQTIVYDHLPGQNKPDFFGYQIIADETDEVIGENPRLLMGATTLGIHDVIRHAHGCGGVVLAAHIDRPAFGIISQLGFIPPDLPLDGVEVSFRVPVATARAQIPGIERFACLCGSDAHYLKDLGRARTRMAMHEPCFEEFRMALRGKDGRSVLEN